MNVNHFHLIPDPVPDYYSGPESESESELPTMVDYDVNNGNRYEYINSNEIPEKVIPENAGGTCMTRKGEDGTCIPLKQCYHFMIGNDLDNGKCL